MIGLNNFNYDYTKNETYKEDEIFYAQKYEDQGKDEVNAIYTPPVSESDKGNIFIEALPRIRSKERIKVDVTKTLPHFHYETLKQKSLEEQVVLLSDLSKIRMVLPNQHTLEAMFHNTLLHVYRARKYRLSNRPRKDKEASPLYCFGKVEEAPPIGFSLLGFAGCGKTSMMGAVLSHYPQVIRHESGDIHFPQITYIRANANSSSRNDFHAILNDIARQVDFALGYYEGRYSNEITKLGNYDKKIAAIKDLIINFNIGAIIIDEIQNIDFRRNDKETYSKILQISNETNVAFVVIGTEESYNKMFYDLHMHRRFPPLIVSSYTGNVQFIHSFLRTLFQYQWFTNRVYVPQMGEYDEVFDGIVKAFYECTNGIVALMVRLYERMNYEAIIKSKEPEINEEFVHRVFKKYSGFIQGLVDKLDKNFTFQGAQKSLPMSHERKANYIAQINVKEDLEDLTKDISQNETNLRAGYLTNMIRSITMCYSDTYQDEQILNACKYILTKKDALEKTEATLTKEAISLLEKKPKRPRKSKKALAITTDFERLDE